MSNLITFQGIDYKVGTTMVAQCVAELMASSRKELQIMLACLGGRGGARYVESVGETVENIRMYLANQVLSPKELLKSCRRTDNFYFLGGPDSVFFDRRYQPEMAAYFAECLSPHVDFILADCGGDPDHGLTAGALAASQQIYCVLTQQESSLERFEKMKPVYEKLGVDFDHLIVNKYLEDDPWDLPHLAERLGVAEEKFFQVAFASGYDRRAEMEYRTLLAYRKGEFLEDIRCIASQILMTAGFPALENPRKSFWKSFI